VTAALVLTAGASAADSGTGAPAVSDAEAVSLLYEDSPPPDCPTEAEFEAEVAKLTSKAHFTKERRARRVRIELSSGGRDVTGRLVSGDGKNQSSRELRGKTCREVASALAIAVALTIDPEALLGPSEATPAKPPEAAAAPEPPPAAPKPPPPKPKPAAPLAPRPVAPPAPTRVHFGVGVGLTLEGTWAPRMSPGGKVLGVIAPGDHLRVALGFTRFLTREVDDVSFGAWLVDGSVSYNLAVLGVVRPFASLGYELGMIEASGSGLPTTVEAERPWQAASAGVGLRLETEGFFLQVGGSLVVPLYRQRYLVSDSLGKVSLLYEVPPVGLKQETSLGVFL
jgi:hypothetical protein